MREARSTARASKRLAAVREISPTGGESEAAEIQSPLFSSAFVCEREFPFKEGELRTSCRQHPPELRSRCGIVIQFNRENKKE